MKARKKTTLRVLIGAALLVVGMPVVLISIELQQEKRDRALIHAIRNVDANTVTRLLNQGANANARGGGEPPLNLPGLVKRLWLKLRGKAVTASSDTSALRLLLMDNGLYPTHKTAAYDTIAVALIQHGADSHVRARLGKTPLDIAAWAGMHQTVRVLLSQGVDVNSRYEHAQTPLMCADRDASALLLQHGANIEARNSDGETPLFYAVQFSNPAKVTLLIEHGANVNATDNHGHHPLFRAMVTIAESPEQAAILRTLTQHGARLTTKDRQSLAQNRNR